MKLRYVTPVFIILFVSLFLNLWGINHDMPYCYEHDEINYVVTALSFGKGNLAPPSFHHGSFLYYFLFVEYVVFYFIKFLLGQIKSSTDFMLYYLRHPETFFLIGRVSVVIFATLSVYLAYLIGKKAMNRFSGYLAALFLALSLLFVNLAHVIREEIVYIFFLLLSFLCVINAKKNNKSFYLAGFLIGLATATKYLAVFGAIFAVSGILLERKPVKESIKNIFIVGVCIVLGFLVVEPFALLDRSSFIADMRGLKGGNYESPIGEDFSNLVWYLSMLYLKRSMGISLFIAFLLSFTLVFRKDRLKINLLFLPYILLYLLFLFSAAHSQPSYLMAVFPFICIYTAIFIGDLICRYFNPRLQNTLIYLTIGFLLAAPSLPNVLRYDCLLTRPDTRAIAKAWIEKNIPENAHILIEGAYPWEIAHNAPLVENEKCLSDELEKIQTKGGNGLLWRTRIFLLNTIKTPKYYLEKEGYFKADTLKRRNPEYIIVCSYYDHGFWITRKERKIFYENLFKKYSLIKKFTASPYIVWFPSFNTLKENPENLRYVNLLRRDQSLVAGPNLEIYKKMK